MREPVRLENDTRRDVPSTIIACSYPSTVVMQMAHEGHPMMAEVATLRNLELVDLPTGHWPMWNRPADLASAIADAVGHCRDSPSPFGLPTPGPVSTPGTARRSIRTSAAGRGWCHCERTAHVAPAAGLTTPSTS